MSNKSRKRPAALLAVGTTILFGAGLASAAAPGTSKGPSTTTDPYVIPVDAAKVQIMSLLTVDDPTPGAGYVVPGLMDGLGIVPDGTGTYTLVSNHEISSGGSVRAHGWNGAFWTRHTVNAATGAVTGSADLATSVDFSGGTPRAFSRFCAGDMGGPANLFNTVTGNGYNGNLFLAGEETGVNGWAVAVDPVAGDAKVLPALGQMSWESVVVADTASSDVTLAIGNNDSSAAGSNLNFFYVGTKTNTGSKYDKAGLTNGSNFGFVVTGATTDAGFRAAYGKNAPIVWSPTTALVATTGTAIQAELVTKGAFQMDRTEDGAWDPSNPNDYYFVTTGTTAATPSGGRGGLWKMSFTDRTNPALGGTLTLLLDGNEGAGPNTAMFMPDNMTIDASGHILIQEDPGNTAYVARIWAYDIATQQLLPIATFDPALFVPGGLTQDEESSGIMPAPAAFGANTFLFDAQAHATAAGLSNPAAQIERGQYLEMTVDFDALFPAAPPAEVPEAPLSVLLPITAAALAGGAVMVQRRRRAMHVA